MSTGWSSAAMLQMLTPNDSLRARLAKVESSLASSAAQLKREEGKFSRLLARVQPAGGTRSRRPA